MKSGMVTFFFGVLFFYQLENLPAIGTITIQFVLLVIVISVFFIFLLRHDVAHRKQMLSIVIFFILGFLWSWIRAESLIQQRQVFVEKSQDLHVVARILTVPQNQQNRSRFDVQILSVSDRANTQLRNALVRLSWYQQRQVVRPGEVWEFDLRLKHPNGFMNPGGMDYEGYLFQQGIVATGYVRSGQATGHLDHTLISQINAWRLQIADSLRLMSDDLHPVIPALALGLRDGLDQEQWDVMRLTGTTHLMAISGLHVGLVAILAYWFGRVVWSIPTWTIRHLPAQRAGAIFAIFGAISYACLAGLTIPTQRAVIMVIVIMLALIGVGRRDGVWPRMDVLCMAMFVVLLVDPSAIIAPGFWLSFIAVSLIFYVTSGRARIYASDRKRPWYKQVGRIHFLLALGMAPVTCFFFTKSPLLSPLANFIAVPVIGAMVTPLTLIGVLALAISAEVAAFFIHVAQGLIDLIWPFLRYLSEFDGWQIMPSNTQWFTVVSASLGFIILLMPRGIPGRMMGMFFLIPLFIPTISTREQGAFDLTVLDVGQGLASVIRTQKHTLVYDTGPKFSESFDTGKAVVVPYLRSQNIKTIDQLLISHADNDHRGGFLSVIAEIPTREIRTSVPDLLLNEMQNRGADQSTIGISITHCEAGQRWRWDGVLFEMLYPGVTNLNQGNDSSCVLRVSNAQQSVLLTGDIEAVAERSLIQSQAHIQADLMIAPHHGSLTSSTVAFVEQVDPTIAIFPVGYLNRFGFPKPAVLERYTTRSIQLFDTASSGAIHFRVDESITLVSQTRKDARHFWHRK